MVGPATQTCILSMKNPQGFTEQYKVPGLSPTELVRVLRLSLADQIPGTDVNKENQRKTRLLVPDEAGSL